MLQHAPVIHLLAPFYAAITICIAGMWRKETAYPIAVTALSLSLLSAVVTLIKVGIAGPVIYAMGGWSAPFGIHFHIDALSALMAVLIQVVALLTAIHSRHPIHSSIGEKSYLYYPLFLLFVTGVTGICQTADAFNLYVLIEVSALTSYALIAMGEKRSVHASFNYLLVGSLGATLYLLGVGYLYLKTGTLNMQDLNFIMTTRELFSTPTIQVALILLMVGLWIKMAQFPFHGWLPNAYTWAPSPSAALMGPLMTKVMVYVMIRFMISVYGLDAIVDSMWTTWVPYLAIAGIVYGSLMALSQHYLRRMVTYIIVAEIGYMVGAAWLATELSITAAFYHVISDALMTLALFLCIAAMRVRHDIRSIHDMENIFKKMPITMVAFSIVALSLVGIPPTSGFISKWYLISAGIDAGHWPYIIALLLASFANAVIFFRIFEIGVFGKKPAEGHHHKESHDKKYLSEAPFSMLIPCLVISASIILLGIFNQPFIEMISTTISSISGGEVLQ